MKHRRERIRLPVVLSVVVTATALQSCSRELPRAPATRHGAEAPATVVMIVLDTFRRDHATPCGADEVLTPNLSALAREGVTFCNLTVPGSWTLPVHASLFTGAPVVEHGADFAIDGRSPGGDFDAAFRVRPLEERFETLAESLSAAGFSTVLVSGNPVVSPGMGLAQGFERQHVARRFERARHGFLWRDVARLAAELRAQPRVFFFVNVALAHDPYEFPPGDGRSPLLLYSQRPEESLALRAELGDRSATSPETVQAVREAYRWGVQQADRDLGLILGALRAERILGPSSLVIVTTDHGEFLGEDGRFDHRRSVAGVLVDGFAIVSGPGLAKGVASGLWLQTMDLYRLALASRVGRTDQALSWMQDLERRDASAWAVSLPDPHFMKLSGGLKGSAVEVLGRSSLGQVQWRSDSVASPPETWTDLKEDSAAGETLLAEANSIGQRLRSMTGQPGVILDPELRRALTAAGYISP